ncbi:MAG: TIGR02281 family clan AA aspartic protease [Rhizobiaceae bacterium]|nr:TIGR02281 family clan AA aspartic protease [Rhizobiaceae bacterium]
MWQYAVSIVGVGLSIAFMANTYILRQEQENQFQQNAYQEQAQHQVNPVKKQRVEKTQARDTVKVTYAGRKTKIKSDSRGHYTVTARMNGRKVDVLVDTGATTVAINRSTARRLGINLNASDFKYQVNTANGSVRAASAIINRIQIGRVSANNVRAAVLPDKSLDGTLLGMSFLNQMRSFEIRNGELVLTQ